MKTTTSLVVLVALFSFGDGAYAQGVPAPAAPAGPTTLWQFLGIPQAVHQCQGANLNKLGNNPDKEVKPPLKAIADPANLQSPNPAVKKAAEIKQEEDLAPQKIKALKYLATIGCACHPGVKEALLAALDDCTEAVRYEAVLAFCHAAGCPCSVCHKTSCCGPDVTKKLRDMAEGVDANGCPNEPSPRVRAAAANAVNACNMVMPETTVPSPVPEKIELPATPRPERGASTTPAVPNDNRYGSLPQNGQESRPPAPRDAGVPVRLVSLEQTRSADDSSPAIGTAGSSDNRSGDQVAALPGGHLFGRPTCPCPCPQVPGTAAPGAPGVPAPAPAPAPTPGQAESAPQAPLPSNALASSTGAAAGPASASPNMIGDFFGGGAYFSGAATGGKTVSAGQAGGDRRFKIVEENSPIPTDRVFLEYDHYVNPLVDVNGNPRNLEHYVLGAEKTLRDGLWSVELRVPFASDYNSTQSTDPGASLSDTELGDTTLSIKRVLLRTEDFTVSAGMAIVFPTGQDWRIVSGGATLCEVKDEAVHLQPFIGAAWNPTDRLFVMAFAQMDFDTHGDTVLEDGINEGIYHEQNLLFLDISAGYWLYKNPCAHWLTGIAPVVELHYTTTMQNSDFVTGPEGSIASTDPTAGGTDPGRRDILNLTGGLHFRIGQLSTLTVAAVVPLKTGVDREFDSEVVVQFDRHF